MAMSSTPTADTRTTPMPTRARTTPTSTAAPTGTTAANSQTEEPTDPRVSLRPIGLLWKRAMRPVQRAGATAFLVSAMALALMTSACEGELHLQFEAARDASSGDGATSTPDANGLGDDGATDDSSD